MRIVVAALLGLTRWSARAGAGILLACAVITAIDVVLRNFFASGVPGTIDITKLAIVWGAFLTIPLGFANNSHIAVEFLVTPLGRRANATLRLVSLILSALAMAACFWWGWIEAAKQVGHGDRSMTIGIPVVFYWAPLLYGTALAGIVSLLAGAAILIPSTPVLAPLRK